jgi:molecular chaperone GrpE
MTSTGWQRDLILAKLSAWLDQTAAEVDALATGDQGTPSDHGAKMESHHRHAATDARDSGPSSQSDTVAQSTQFPVPATPAELTPFVPHIGLLQVVEALTAMRHELKLHTKSARGVEQAVEQAVSAMQTTVRQLQAVPQREREQAEQGLLPVLESLAMLDESLHRGRRALELVQEQFLHTFREQLRGQFAAEWEKLTAWARWVAGPAWQRARQALEESMVRKASTPFESVLQGYQLIQQRLKQRLDLHGVTRITTVGKIVDAKCMTVVALAEPDEGPPETVVEELRPGYRWRELVLRFAEVKAVPSR